MSISNPILPLPPAQALAWRRGVSGLLWEGRGFPTLYWALPGRLWGRLTSGHPLCSPAVPARGQGWQGEPALLEETQLPRRHHQDTARWWREPSRGPRRLARAAWEAVVVGGGRTSLGRVERPQPRQLSASCSSFLTSDYAILKPPPLGGPDGLW